jgi:dolichol-phosphate mannosyltransferase
MNQQKTNCSGCYVSVVAPAYNEAANLPILVSEVSKALRPLQENFEIVIVNDASSDSSLEVLDKMIMEYPELRILSLLKRSGQTAAIDAGIRNAKGRYIAMLDADLQNVPTEIPRMIDILKQQQCDMVNGWRDKRNDPWIRLISTRIANGVRNWLTHETIRDSACGLKVFRAECMNKIKLFNGMHRFLPTLFKMEGFSVIEVAVNHRPRVAGKTKYGIGNRLFKGLRDTFAIRWMQRWTLRYEIKEHHHS